jgi:hypothetical protein
MQWLPGYRIINSAGGKKFVRSEYYCIQSGTSVNSVVPLSSAKKPPSFASPIFGQGVAVTQREEEGAFPISGTLRLRPRISASASQFSIP